MKSKFQILRNIAAFFCAAIGMTACSTYDRCEIDPSQALRMHKDTVIEVGSHAASIEWTDADSTFRPPYVATHIVAGDTVSHMTTEKPVFFIDLPTRGVTTVFIADGDGDKFRLRVKFSIAAIASTAAMTALLIAFFGICLWAYIRKQHRHIAAARQELADAHVKHTKKYDCVTVLFADIQGFTKIAAHMNPDQLVDALDRYFIYFDEIVDRYGVEKIKTIGDAYMCAGGVPDADSANPIEVALVGLEMIAYVNERRAHEHDFWNIRVGINTGPVISGSLGNIKKVFDIWGDSVNTASRMESSSEAGRVNVSEDTYMKIRDYFECEHRGRMPVKYKGEIDMYFVNRLKPEYCQDGSTFKPNETLMRKLQILKANDFEQKVRDDFMSDAHPNMSRRLDMLLSRVSTLASSEGLDDEQLVTCNVSAIFYFVQTEFPHEASHYFESSETIFKRMHLSERQKERINRVSSRIGQNKEPENIEEQILSDAAHEAYGRKDIVRLMLSHYADVASRGTSMTLHQWMHHHRKHMEEYNFYTASARTLAEVEKKDQLTIIDEAIKIL